MGMFMTPSRRRRDIRHDVTAAFIMRVPPIALLVDSNRHGTWRRAHAGQHAANLPLSLTPVRARCRQAYGGSRNISHHLALYLAHLVIPA